MPKTHLLSMHVATLLLMMMMRGIWTAKREVWAVEGEKGQRGTK
jgi:hypothetical protein